MTDSALPHGFHDGLGGALALVADRFSDADLEHLRGCFAVVEHFEPVLDPDGEVDGWLPTRWPLECDAALATLAARALAPNDPALQLALARLRAGCDDDELRRMAGVVRADMSRVELENELVRIASRPSSDASRALARAHRLVPLASYDVHRSLASSSASAAATLLRLALAANALTPRQLVETARGWAPVGHHGSRSSAPHLMPATWPGFAVLLAGTTDATLPARLAEGFATAPDLDVARARFEASTEGLEGAGLVALLGDEGIVLRRGTVRAWRMDAVSVTDVVAPSARHGAQWATWGLGVGELDEAALPSVATRPLDRALGRLLPSDAPGLAELFFGPSKRSTPARLAAVALVRAPTSPRPSIPPDPIDLATRRAALEALVEQALQGTRGLDATVVEAGYDGTNDAWEQLAVLRAVVIRDDVAGSSSELDAVRAIERALEARPELSPCEVVGDYVK